MQDIPSMAEAVAKLQSMQIPPDKPLTTFNLKFQQIHHIAYNVTPDKQTDKMVIIDYVKKLPLYSRDKLLKKLSRKDSYIKTLKDAFHHAVEINRKMSLVDATTGRTLKRPTSETVTDNRMHVSQRNTAQITTSHRWQNTQKFAVYRKKVQKQAQYLKSSQITIQNF